ncbi:MAG: hypothetical protein FJX45_06610 [Alphaproteobacteria bacterium]|nr:hypothetical protein [Alphaproteobacteria bacterium]MBM3651752.1 hypothetical protein [Alphaproteobacteria bacterium]
MPFSNSRLMPLAFWVGFLALGLATNVPHETKARGVARDRHEMSLASAADKRLPLLLIQYPGQTVLRD